MGMRFLASVLVSAAGLWSAGWGRGLVCDALIGHQPYLSAIDDEPGNRPRHLRLPQPHKKHSPNSLPPPGGEYRLRANTRSDEGLPIEY